MSNIKNNKGINFQVVHDDIECLTVTIHTKIAKHMIGYGLILKDLNQCISCIEEIRNFSSEDKYHTIKWSLYIAFHTTYGKCFTIAKGRKVRLESNHFVPSKFKKAHQKIMLIRNKYTAHGDNLEERGVAAVGLNPDKNDKKILQVMSPVCLHVSNISDHDLNIYEPLINILKSKVAEKIESKRVRLEAELSSMDINELYNAAN